MTGLARRIRRRSASLLGALAIQTVGGGEAAPAAGQEPQARSVDLATAVAGEDWLRPEGRELSVFEEEGRRGLRIGKGRGTQVLLLRGTDIEEGCIEVDLRGNLPVFGSAPGVVFRAASAGLYDAVYFRPMSFKEAGSIGHIQYVSTPKKGPGPPSASDTAAHRAFPTAPDPAAWFHVRIELRQRRVEVFVDGAAEPCMSLEERSDRRGGMVGLWIGPGSCPYANLRVTDRTKR